MGIPRSFVNEFTKRLVEEGKIIEAGWVGFKTILPPNAPEVQFSEMRKAFFAGAQHLFSSIMVSLDPEAEPTDADLRRMDNIHGELKEFIEKWKQSSFT